MRQAQSTISPKYQTVVPKKVRKLLHLKAGDRIIWTVILTQTRPTVIAEPLPKKWSAHTRGLGKNIWKNVDIDKYIESLRKEWVEQN
ncbi:hypothetical protein A3D76_06905 [Candidatus Roizmanbacteria bacterium RIFCSPHIGHO2_02_FULL_37_9b]|nr:MAG: hypothetical protein A3D76_06905 [Candidatus Roizmanbacteria bacterium RIFCSPHIGHO2_02_FULL_37_9b]